MAVKHVNFAGKTAVGQSQRPKATAQRREMKPLAAAPKRVKKATLQPISPISKASLRAGASGAVAAGTGRVGGEVIKSGGGYKSNPTYGKGLGITQSTKITTTRKVKGH